MAKNKRKINFLDVVLFFVVLTAASWFVSVMLFWFMVGLTAVLGFVYLVLVWDELVAWWSTRR